VQPAVISLAAQNSIYHCQQSLLGKALNVLLKVITAHISTVADLFCQFCQGQRLTHEVTLILLQLFNTGNLCLL